MTTDDEYLVYTGHHNTTFYFKNKKLHREAGPAIVCKKDNNKKKFEGLGDEGLYTRVFEPVFEPNEKSSDSLLYIVYHCDSVYYLDGVRYSSKQEMDAFMLNNELEKNLKPSQDKKMKI